MTPAVAPPRSTLTPRVRPTVQARQPVLSVPPAKEPKRKQEGKWFLNALSLILLGYAVFGKPFAYLGFPPVYVGEMVLAFGVLTVLRYPSMVGAMVRAPLFPLLAVFVFWNAACTIPYFDQYRWDSLRDGALWGYSVFALLVYGILLRDPKAPSRLIARYRGFSLVFLPFVTTSLILGLSGASMYVPSPKYGDIGVHTAGATAFMLTHGFPAYQWVISLVPVFVVMSRNRGGALSFLSGLLVAGAFSGKKWRWGLSLYLLVAGLFMMYLLDIQLGFGSRNVSLQTVLRNAETVISAFRVNPVDDPETEDLTARWRIMWWTKIVDYTVYGDYFWMGKGYGINLAVDDDFVAGGTKDAPLRSPHNSHLTFLARAGVPGFVIWAVLQLSWVVLVWARVLRSRNLGKTDWYATFVFLLAYWCAFTMNAMFDVFLEGPMGGIWFWVLFGTGMACVRSFDLEIRRERASP